MNTYEIVTLIIGILGLIIGILTLFSIRVPLRDALRKIWGYVKDFIKSTIVPILTGKKGAVLQWTSVFLILLLVGGISYGAYMHFTEEGGEYVIRSTAEGFEAPGRLTQGIAWDGTYLWLSDNSAEIFKVDTSGETLGAYSSPAPTPEGLTWDGSTFWIFTTNYGYIYQFSIDESGNVPKIGKKISSFDSPAQTFGAINHGLAWDGANLWFSDYYKVYKIDTEGNVLSNFDFQHEIAGLAWDGEKLWIAYNSFPENAILVMTDTEGNILSSFTAPVYYIDALTWGDGYLWAAGKGSLGGESMIYKIEVIRK